MKTNRTLTRAITGVLLTGGIAVGGLGLAGTGEAHKPHNWCPGQPMNYPTGPGPGYSWDMNICHTWFWVSNGKGNVPYNGRLPSTLWDGAFRQPASEPPGGTDIQNVSPRNLK